MRSSIWLLSGQPITFPYQPDPHPLRTAAAATNRWTETGDGLALHKPGFVAADLAGVRHQIHETAQDTISDAADLIATIHTAHTAPGYLIDPSHLPPSPSASGGSLPAVVLFTTPIAESDTTHVGLVHLGATTHTLERQHRHIRILAAPSPYARAVSDLLEHRHWYLSTHWDHALTLAPEPC